MRTSLAIILLGLLTGLWVTGCSDSEKVGENSGQDPQVLGIGSESSSGDSDFFSAINSNLPDPTKETDDLATDVVDTDASDEDASEDEDTATQDDTEIGALEPEVCGDGVDNDGDGLADCADPVCAEGPTCVEQSCGDLTDNDSDGKTDCEDDDCFGSELCQIETCESFYLCLAEEGCACTMENNCPEPGTEAFISCQMNCQQDESGNCVQGCVDELSINKQIDLASLQTCTKNNCAQEQNEEDYDQCVIEECLQEFASCFYGGTIDCGEFYYECGQACDGDEDCIAGCRNALSSEGYVDSVTWDTCRDDLCDLNDDGDFDSDSCYYLASFFACANDAGTCIPDHLMENSGTCKSVSDCLLSCTSFEKTDDNTPCVLSCLSGVGVKNIIPVSDLLSCMIASCGSTSDKLTPLCAAEALANSCQNEWAECSNP